MESQKIGSVPSDSFEVHPNHQDSPSSFQDKSNSNQEQEHRGSQAEADQKIETVVVVDIDQNSTSQDHNQRQNTFSYHSRELEHSDRPVGVHQSQYSPHHSPDYLCTTFQEMPVTAGSAAGRTSNANAGTMSLIKDSASPSSSEPTPTKSRLTIEITNDVLHFRSTDPSNPIFHTPLTGLLRFFLSFLSFFRLLSKPFNSPTLTVPSCFVIAATSPPSKTDLPGASLPENAAAIAAATSAGMQRNESSDTLHQTQDSPLSRSNLLVSIHFLYNGLKSTAHPPDGKVPVYRVLTVETADLESKVRLLKKLRGVGVATPELDAYERVEPRKEILVVVNPFGGVKDAPKIYKDVVSPMLTVAGLKHELLETTHKGHAEEIGRSVDPFKYSAAVTISGDGVFHEVIHGMMTRRDWRAARLLPVAAIGGGSSNAMNRNLDVMHPLYGALNVVKNQTRPMDLMSVTHHSTNQVFYTHLSFTFAYIGDLDIEADNFRWIGRERTVVSALNRLIHLRRYRAHIHILPSDKFSTNPLSPTFITTPTHLLDPTELDPPHLAPHFGPPRYLSAAPYTTWPIYIDPSQDPVSYFTACNVPYIATDYMAAPEARLCSGSMEVHVGFRTRRVDILKGMLEETVDGARRKGKGGEGELRSFGARGVHVRPLGWSWDVGKWEEGGKGEKLETKKGCVMAVSGEPLGMGDVTLEVHEGMMSVVAPPWLVEGVSPSERNKSGGKMNYSSPNGLVRTGNKLRLDASLKLSTSARFCFILRSLFIAVEFRRPIAERFNLCKLGSVVVVFIFIDSTFKEEEEEEEEEDDVSLNPTDSNPEKDMDLLNPPNTAPPPTFLSTPRDVFVEPSVK
ncbi:hypothetical protein HDV05_006693 [Chytridiales sp. JEL 0842]|nr:hypothetical protein HDV05_006693 [Chytridiales sp. JEL 0842]